MSSQVPPAKARFDFQPRRSRSVFVGVPAPGTEAIRVLPMYILDEAAAHNICGPFVLCAAKPDAETPRHVAMQHDVIRTHRPVVARRFLVPNDSAIRSNP